MAFPNQPPEWAEDPSAGRPPGRASGCKPLRGSATTATMAARSSLPPHRASASPTIRLSPPVPLESRKSAPVPTSGVPDVHWPPPLPPRSVQCMDPDTTYKRILSFSFMVEELMRWLVADRHGMHALVDALDLSTLTRMHEQSVSSAGAAQRRYGNDMVWRVNLRERSGGRYGRTGRAQRPNRFTVRRRRGARSLRAVAVPGGDAGVPVQRGLPDAVAHPQLRRQLPHGAVARPAVSLPPSASRRCCPSCSISASRAGLWRRRSSTW